MPGDHARRACEEKGPVIWIGDTRCALAKRGASCGCAASQRSRNDAFSSRARDAGTTSAMVNLTGGFYEGLVDTVNKYDKAFPGRFYAFTEPCYPRFKEPDYPKIQADAIEQAKRDGAKGLKILKTLGLYLRENITSGTLVKIDDPRFDPMWDACGQLNLPVAIHVSDPIAFFTPTDRFNERYEELNNHPDWSFYDHDFLSNAELLAARNRGGDARNDAITDDQPLFQYPQQLFGDALYEIYYRFLETDDEYFDYAPAKIPPQGRWKIYGIELPDSILKKVYYENAARLLHVSMSA